MSTTPDFEINGLRVELATRPMRGAPVPGGHPRRWVSWTWLIPAVALAALLLVPSAITVVQSVRTQPEVPLWCAVGAAAFVSLVSVTRRRGMATRADALATIALGVLTAVALLLLADALTPAGARAYAYTLGMVVLAVLLLAVALWIAWITRDRWWLWLPLIAPCAVAALVSGVAFRLMFQRLADWLESGEVSAHRYLFFALPFVAFVWTWFGFAAALLRDGIRAVEADPVRAGYLRRARGVTWLRRLLEQLRPVILVVGLVVGVAAARVFDVILIGVPWTLQDRAASATVHWWLLASDHDAASNEAAVYALPLAALVGVVAWWLQTDVSKHRTAPSSDGFSSPRQIRRRPGFLGCCGGLLVFAVFWAPIVTLVVAAVYGPYGFQLDAIKSLVSDQVLGQAMLTTAWVAALATLLVVTAAVPVAHRLAAVASDGWFARIAVVFLVVLAVLPVQSYLGPLDAVIDDWGLSGTRVPLILVHAAAGLPIAILILRAALLAPPGSAAADALHGLASHSTTARRVLDTAWPALGAVAVLELIQVWNDFCVGLMISGAGGSPWSLLLWGEARQFEENAARLAAGSLVSAVGPVLLMMITWRRWLVPGLTGGVLR
ncbi:hypothetical protein [Nocardia sp. NPDC005366]|uniref:hypothetical protein n=1 Tax=Nocardia sp. NPDC005366 TaxID=3156878 RepID=UPI0033B88F08